MTDGVDQQARDHAVRLEKQQDQFVRADVYRAEKDGMIARIAEVEKDSIALEAKVDKNEERRAADRRLILTSLVLPILIGILMLYVQTQVGTGK